MIGLEDKGWAVIISCLITAFKATTPSLQTTLMKYMLGKGMLSENCSSCTAGHKGLWSTAQIAAGDWSIVKYSQSIWINIFLNDLGDRIEWGLRNQKDELIWHVVVLPFRGVLTGWRKRLTETSCKPRKERVKFYIWVGTTPLTYMCWGINHLGSSFAVRDRGC